MSVVAVVSRVNPNILDSVLSLARFSPLYLSDLEVTGISRSGRVRKKSSKLMDFESPDDLADKHKKQRAQQQQLQAQQLLDRFDSPPPPSGAGQAQTPGHGARNRKNSGSLPMHKIKLEPAPSVSDTEGQSSDSDSDDATRLNDDDRFSMDSGSDDDVDPLMIDEKETGFRRLEPPEQETPSQANSLYMLEKCKKKLIIKDGKIIGRMKAQRKDKGVSFSFFPRSSFGSCIFKLMKN